MVLKTQILEVPPDGSGGASAYRKAVELLRKGDLVAFPSETVYGLGGDACQRKAVEAIFAAKGRPADNPLIVHVASAEQALAYGVALDQRFWLLANAFWPGPLTMVLPLAQASQVVAGKGLTTIALRVPSHPVALRLIRESGLALAAPSANLSGKPSPTNAQHVAQDLSGRISMILDGGPCEVGIESTVVDLSGESTRILRPGSIEEARIARVLNARVTLAEDADARLRSPGTRYQHYQPNAAVWVLAASVDAPLWNQIQAILRQADLLWGYVGRRHVERSEKVPNVYLESLAGPFAHGLYRALRDLDAQGLEVILIDSPPPSSAALQDRLSKAASAWVPDCEALEVLIAKEKAPEQTSSVPGLGNL